MKFEPSLSFLLLTKATQFRSILAFQFQAPQTNFLRPRSTTFTTQVYANSNPGPPLDWVQSSNNSNDKDDNNENEGESTLKANRFSVHAPDPNLPTDEFRNELKENMKRDLERRRAADPNRGNQPAKNYLDNL